MEVFMIYHATPNTFVRCGRIIKLMKLGLMTKKG